MQIIIWQIRALWEGTRKDYWVGDAGKCERKSAKGKVQERRRERKGARGKARGGRYEREGMRGKAWKREGMRGEVQEGKRGRRKV